MNIAKTQAITSYTHPISSLQADTLKNILNEQGFVFSEKPYTLYSGAHKTKKVNVSVYTSGKLLIQGKGTCEFLEFVLEPLVFKKISMGYENVIIEQTKTNEIYEEKIGGDESGKGDYFGPLVIAAAYLKKENLAKIRELQVQDSKKITDKKINSIYPKLIKHIDFEVVVIMPEKYNQLFDSMKNLNKILAWGHAAAVEKLSKKVNCSNILIDKFAKEYLIENHLKNKIPNLKLKQQTKAESDAAVAAASVVARYHYLLRLKELGEKFNLVLPKGAGKPVDEAGRNILKTNTMETLSKIAKIHFKTTQKIT